MKVLAPCATAAALEEVAGAELLEEEEAGVEPLEPLDEVGVPVLAAAVLEAVKVTPCKTRKKEF